MDLDDRPLLGFLQPKTGLMASVSCARMGRRSKKDRLPAMVCIVFRDNVVRLRNRKWAALPDETSMNRALAKACDTTLSQAQRITGVDPPAVGIDFVERIAFVFDVRPQDMLTPYFAAAVAHDSQSDDGPRDPDSRRAGRASVHELAPP